MIKERVINNLVESIVSKSEVEDSIKRRKGEKKEKRKFLGIHLAFLYIGT